ncbi:MAG: exonuclease SbcCD subunit D, partial [Ruminococcus sp.]|nr:exonuclease SbcCD subunit D [Ruminococcus sp.]
MGTVKLFHLSDLHLGRKLSDYPLAEEQEHILNEILKAVDEEMPDGVIIAGDVYDKPVPSEDAVNMFDGFLTGLAERGVKTFVVSGNHDSAERVAFGGRLMERAGVFISPAYDGNIEGIALTDDINVYLMPFIREYAVRAAFPEREIRSLDDAVRTVVENIKLDRSKVNILAAHQFVTGKADGSDVERGADQFKAVGGVDNIDVNIFGGFDYVALGHIHKPQRVGRDTVRYCGSPLKYSFDEADQRKAVVVAEIDGRDIKTREIPLTPLRDLKVFEGTFGEIMALDGCDDYVKVILTEAGTADVFSALSKKFPHIAETEFRLPGTVAAGSRKGIKEIGAK